MKTEQYQLGNTEIKPFERPRHPNESSLTYYITETIASLCEYFNTDI